MLVFGQHLARLFARKYPDARKPLDRFMSLANEATWAHFPEMKETLPSADYARKSGKVIVDIGGNKYRLIAIVDFAGQVLSIEQILTHQYDRKEF